jgi:MbtH protein
MNSEDGSDGVIYQVVVNNEEQYSIWSIAKSIAKMMPPGWSTVGVQGLKSECLAHIGNVWTDMRPRNLRRATFDGELLSKR